MPSYSSNSAMRSGLDAQANFMTELTRRSYESVRKLSELNLQFAQQLMQDSVAATRQVLACSDPLQMASTLANATQPAEVVLRGTLGDIADQVEAAGLRQAAVILVGRALAPDVRGAESYLYDAARDRSSKRG